MKNLFLLLSLVALPCAAQPQTKAPQIRVEPAAKVILDAATATYHASNGIRFNLMERGEEEESRYSVAFQRPNLLRVESHKEAKDSRLLFDGKAAYTVEGTKYDSDTMPKKASELWLSGLSNGTGFLISSMLEGRSPVVALQDTYKNYSGQLQQPNVQVTMAPSTVVAGVPLHGVRMHFANTPGRKTTQMQLPPGDLYLWFNPQGLLSRIYSQTVWDGETQILVEQLSDQQLNPTFDSDTFQFDATGLTLRQTITPATRAAAERKLLRFDSRLKVGAKPFAFSAKDLNGKSISPANYKGKVLLLDFWATWCGPCVRGLPEIKSVYSKYHAQGFEVVGISLDEDKKALTSFTRQNKMAWSQVFDGKGWNARVARIYGVRSIPFLLLVGKNGTIAAVSPRGELEEVVKKALAAR